MKKGINRHEFPPVHQSSLPSFGLGQCAQDSLSTSVGDMHLTKIRNYVESSSVNKDMLSYDYYPILLTFII